MNQMLYKPGFDNQGGRAIVEIGLNAAIVALTGDQPQVLTVRAGGEGIAKMDSLPYGPFTPLEHRTLEIGLRDWVNAQTAVQLGYVEQLYTFGDRGRHARKDDAGPHVVSIGYLALTHLQEQQDLSFGTWRSWYLYFPWEDWRDGKPEVLTNTIEPRLQEWAEKIETSADLHHGVRRLDRIRLCFGGDGVPWDEEKVLDRYELLYEAGLLVEAAQDGREASSNWPLLPQLGQPMRYDHRRILATAMGRLRGKIKYRPVVFEVMPETFTLFELQKTVEAILGSLLHKQNFRRLVEHAGLVEPTGEVRTHTGGRPAKLFQFRRNVLMERPAPGVRVKPGHA